jgi:manganese transport protein
MATPTLNQSLREVHSTVSTAHPTLWRRMFAFAGPAYLISVGYMDPGNWATDLEGGARFGYQLLWVLVVSNLMAILLQTLSARLGIVTQRDLAQACQETYPRALSIALWMLCEIAIAACDLAEVLGAAIALNLLFHIPLLTGVLLTAADTLLVLWFTNLGIRVVESFVLALVAVIAVCFLIEICWARPSPNWPDLAHGLIPQLNSANLYIAIGILGATVMPHNLYLHSALVQTRRISEKREERRAACRFNLIDSVVALNGALLVNAAILVLAASVFWTRKIVVTQIQDAHQLLTPIVGTTAASILFAIALLCSGQSSTLTGTMAGQVVMEGFLQFRMRPWLRRLVTRLAAIIPAAIVVYIAGDHGKGTFQLLIVSQIILNFQLPFAVIPLVHFTSDKSRMGEFANRVWVKVLAWGCAALIVILNVWLVSMSVHEWLAAAGGNRWWLELVLFPALTGLLLLLLWVTLDPILPKWLRRSRAETPLRLPEAVAVDLPHPSYHKILVPLDHTDRDRDAIAHASSLALTQHSKLYLLHIEEGVTSQIYGPLSSTVEVEAGLHYFHEIESSLQLQGVDVELVVRHSRNPKREIVAYARELSPDLIVMGAHGHKGLKDLIFGTTISAVRHNLKIPLLVVRR